MAKRTYQEACHAMQTGVAYEMELNPKPSSPKHLRVGINSALVETSMLAKILMEKGIITEKEYLDRLCDAMNAEVNRYEKYLSETYNVKITLG